MSNKTPVAFFAYNRPIHTLRALDALAKCRKIEDCELYLFSDGSRTDAARSEVEETRVILHQWAKAFDAHVVEQPCNLGLAKSIVTGVSDLCARYGRVIVVEDDLVVSPDFLHYMIQSLNHYENETHVMQVSGFTISPPDDLAADVFLLPVTTTWGWATWQRAWQHFSWKPANLEAAKLDKKWLDLFNLNDTCGFSSMLDARMAGSNDSWGVLWWYAVSRQRGLVAYPKESLVWNGGFDGTGVHCGAGDILNQGQAADYFQSDFSGDFKFSSTSDYDPAHLSQLEAFFRDASKAESPMHSGSGHGSRIKSLMTKIRSRLVNAFD
jgi:hypothetical protein